MTSDSDDVGRSRRFRLAGALDRVDVPATVAGVPVVRALAATVVGLVLAYLLVPVLSLALVSVSSGSVHAILGGGVTLSWYGRLLSSPWPGSVALTAAYSSLSAVLSVVLGGSVAYAVDRFDVDVGRFLAASTLWPVFVPQVALGFGLFLVLQQYDLVGNALGLSLALAVFATPYASRTLLSALTAFDRDLEAAAYVLGADEIQTFVRVTLPSLAPGLLAAAVFAFVVSVTNLQVAVFLTTPDAVPLPVRVFAETRTDATPVVAAVATLDVAVALVATVVVERAFGVREAFVE